MKITMIVTNAYEPDIRVHKEAKELVEKGHEVHVLCWDRESIYPDKALQTLDGVTIQRFYPMAKYGTGLKQVKGLLSFIRLTRKTLKELGSDVIHAHDLDGLITAYLGRFWFFPKRNRPQLVYDSHEFELGRNTGSQRSKLLTRSIFMIERFLIKRCAFSIMVSDSIADEVKRIYKLKERPIVVRNIPPNWTLDATVIQAQRAAYYERLKLSQDTGFILMYHGFITIGRGVETLIRLMSKTTSMGLVILGFGQEAYLKELKALAEAEGVKDKILFEEAVPQETLWRYVGAVDVGMITIPDDAKSVYYMLPNKLFENIQSKTPLIVSDFPDIKRIVEGYDIGVCVDPRNEGAILKALSHMKEDKEAYTRYKTNLIKAKAELNWENEQKVLFEAYKSLSGVKI